MYEEAERFELPDGQAVVVRPIRPDGAERLAEAIQRLSPRSRYQRFLSARAHYTARQLEHFVRCDWVNTIGIVLAPIDSEGCELFPVGVAHCLRDAPASDRGEVAVTVSDDWQGRGVGTLLLRCLRKRALAVGISRWWALILSDNLAAKKILETTGHLLKEKSSDGRTELEFVVKSTDTEPATCRDGPCARQ